MEPNLELVTGSFFTGMSKAGIVLRERIFEASLKGNFYLFFFFKWVFVAGRNANLSQTQSKTNLFSFALNILKQLSGNVLIRLTYVDASMRKDGDVDGLFTDLCCHLVDIVGHQITPRS